MLKATKGKKKILFLNSLQLDTPTDGALWTTQYSTAMPMWNVQRAGRWKTGTERNGNGKVHRVELLRLIARGHVNYRPSEVRRD